MPPGAGVPVPSVARMRTVAFRTGLGLCAGAILIVAFVQLVDMGAVYARL